jgi:tetratricopeptide (TPR) repeat protein
MPTYVVREEDTLASIAEYFTVSTPDILAANPGLTTDSVTEGRSLKIPVSQEQAVSKELSYAALELEEADIGARAVEVSFIALGLDPNNGEAYFAMGIGLYNLGKPVESVDPLKKAVELRPQVAIYHTWLAAALLATGDTAGARLEAEEALRLQPDEPIALGVLDSLESAPPPSATRQPAAMPTPGLTETPPPQIETPTPTFGPVPAAYAGLGLDGEAAGGGVVVQEVYAGGPAENAGLKAGDVITAVDGQSVSNAEAVADAIVKKRPGDEITLSVRRDGQEEDIVVTLGERIGG